VGAWDGHVEAGGFEDFDGSFGGGGEEVIVKRVGPEEDGVVELRSTGRPGAAVPT
jgi:hypothetical protein